MFWKYITFKENLRLTKDFFEEKGVAQPKYSELMRNMLGDVLCFAFDFLYNRKKKEEFCIDKNSACILEEMKMGGIFLTAHYGHHELLGYRLAELGLHLNSASVVQKPAFFNNYLQRKRTCQGKCFAKQKSPKESLEFLKTGGLFALLADQNFKKPCPRPFSKKCEGEFLGVKVRCNPFPIFLLEHCKEKPVFCGYLGQLRDEQTLYLKKLDANNLYQDYHSWLESLVLKNPAKWYGWIHRRFAIPRDV